MKLYKIMFINSLIMGSLLSISSYSWLSIWIGLEINLLSIIPLLKTMENKFPSESALKYFIVQTLASSLLLFSTMMFFSLNFSSKDLELEQAILTGTTLLLKMGAAPFHFWLPEIMSGLNWTNTFLMLTWQKIAPIILLSYLIKMNIIYFSIIIIISSMISGISGLNQICLRKILAYSSINHVSWMISSLLNSILIFIFYFMIYSIINMSIIYTLKNFNIFYMNQLSEIFNYSKLTKFLFMLNFLSLSGLPPLMGFFPKWLTISNMVENEMFTLPGTLIIFTLISMYFYMRITFSTFSYNMEETLLFMLKKINSFYFFLNFLSLSGLIYCSMINSLY